MLTIVPTSLVPVDQFQTRLKAVCGAFEAEPAEKSVSTIGAIEVEKRAGLEMAHVANDLQLIRRTKRHISQDGAENFFLIVQEEGHALMSQRETARMLWPGDMILIDSAVPSEFSFFGTFGRQLSVHLPRAEMVAHFGNGLTGGHYLPRSDFTAMALTAVLAKAFAPLSNDEQTGYLRQALLGLIGAMLHERSQGAATPQIDAEVALAQLLERGLAFIDRMSDDSELTVQTIASELGVSIRQLQRAFALAGMTPTDYLLQKRLERACQLLRKRGREKNGILVSTIAYSCGFNDVSYFNRQFRRVFGCAPGQYSEH